MRTRISLILALCFICATPVRAGECPHKIVVTLIASLGLSLASMVPEPQQKRVIVGTVVAIGAYVSWWVYSVLPKSEEVPEADME